MYTYLWSTGDTTSQIKVYESGTYFLRLNYAEKCNVVFSANIENKKITTPLLNNDTSICDDNGLLISSRTPYVKYLWSNGDTTQSIYIAQSDTIWLAATNLFGCSSTDTMSLILQSVPHHNLGNDTLICDTITLSGPGGSEYRYLWSSGDTTQHIRVNQTGYYSLRLFINNCFSDDTVTIENKVITTPVLGNDTSLCDDAIFQYSSLTPYNKYYWFNGDTLQNTKINQQGNIWLKATNQYGCSSTDSMYVTFHPTPKLYLGTDTAFCEGSSLLLDGKNPSAKYLWSTSDTARFLNVFHDGTYYLKVTNSYGCSTTDTITIYLKYRPKSSFLIDSTKNPAFHFINTTSNANFSLWQFGNGDTSIVTSPLYTYNSKGLYLVRLKSSNDCGIDSIAQFINVNISSTTQKLLLNDKFIQLFPNPSENFITLKYNSPEHIEKISILDISGKIVYEVNDLPDVTVSINTSFLNPGMYFLHFKSQSIYKCLKFIKK